MPLIDLKNELIKTLHIPPFDEWGIEELENASTFLEVVEWLIKTERLIFTQINAEIPHLDKTQSLLTLHENKDGTLQNLMDLDKKLALLNAVCSEFVPEMLEELEDNGATWYDELKVISDNMGVPNEASLDRFPGYKSIFKSAKDMLLLHFIKCYEMGPLNAQFISDLSRALGETCPDYKPTLGYFNFSLAVTLSEKPEPPRCSRPTNIERPFYTFNSQVPFDATMRSDLDSVNDRLPEGYVLTEQTFANIVSVPINAACASPAIFKITFTAGANESMFEILKELANATPSEKTQISQDHQRETAKRKSNYFESTNRRELLSQMESGMFFIFKNDARIYYIPAQFLILHETVHMLHHAQGKSYNGVTESYAHEIHNNSAWGGMGQAPVEEFWTTAGTVSEYTLTVDAGFVIDGAYQGRRLYNEQHNVPLCQIEFASMNGLRNKELITPIIQQVEPATPHASAASAVSMVPAVVLADEGEEEERESLDEAACNLTSCFGRGNCSIS